MPTVTCPCYTDNLNAQSSSKPLCTSRFETARPEKRRVAEKRTVPVVAVIRYQDSCLLSAVSSGLRLIRRSLSRPLIGLTGSESVCKQGTLAFLSKFYQ